MIPASRKHVNLNVTAQCASTTSGKANICILNEDVFFCQNGIMLTFYASTESLETYTHTHVRTHARTLYEHLH